MTMVCEWFALKTS
jgi:hypothetical protein